MSVASVVFSLLILPFQSPTEMLTGMPDAPAAEAADVTAPAAPIGPCANAQRAVATWLDNLQPHSYSPKAARTCALPPPGMNPKGTERALVKLKKVLDARGAYVRIAELPNDPDHHDALSGKQTVTVSTLVDEIEVIKADGRWVISPETLALANELHTQTFPFDLERVVQNFPAWSLRPIFGLAAWQLGALLLLLLLGLFARYVISHVIASQLKRVLGRFKFTWGESALEHAAIPVGTLALAGVFFIGIPSLTLPVRLATVLMVAARVVAAVSVVMLAYRAVDVASSILLSRTSKTDTKLDDQLVPILTTMTKVVIVIVGIIFVLQNLEINVTSLLTGLGLGGLAVALAAKDTAANFFGSITIFTDQPFQIGDWVTVEGVEGVIEEVGMRSTRIRTFYNSVVTVPNGRFTEAIIDNYGLREHRRCSIKLGLTYDTPPLKMEAFCDGVRGIIKAHPATRKDYYEVHFSGFGDFSLEVMLYFFFNVPSWSEEIRARHEIYLDLLRLAETLGVSYAFPTQTLHLETVAAAKEISPPPELTAAALKDIVVGYGPDGENVIPPGQRIHPGFYAGK